MTTTRVEDVRASANPIDHFAAAQRHSSLSTLLRITLLNLRHPRQAAIAIVSTIIASSLMLRIPRLLGEAVDQARPLLSGGNVELATSALWSTALLLLGVSIARGLFTLSQNYFSESVGHHLCL